MSVRIPAAIFDRDGTTFSVAHYKDPVTGDIKCWHCYNGLAAFDSPVPDVVDLMRMMAHTHTIIMTSGREDFVRPAFEGANYKADLPVDLLIMRKTGDKRKDSVVKLEIYREQIEPYYDVKLVVDDRPQVCDMWIELGLPLIKVVDPGILPRLGG
jgi:hypothetical protein